jgi:hypothetical protein
MNYLSNFLKNISLLALFSFIAMGVPTFAQSLGAFDILGIPDLESLFGLIITFLKNLAVPAATLVIIWGGYLYFQEGFGQKADGLKAIQSAILGVILIYGVDIIVSTARSIAEGSTRGRINTDPIFDIIYSLSNSLILLSSVIAVAVIIWGGYQYMFSSLPNSKADGRATITNGILGLVAVLLANPIVNLVKSVVPENSSKIGDIQVNPVVDFILGLLNSFVIPISTVVTVVFFIIGGYYYLTAGSNDSNAKKGLEYIRNAIIGLVIVLTAFTLTQVVVYVVGGLKL